MALHRANPAALRHDDGDRLALDHRLQRNVARRAGLLDQRAAFAQRSFRAVAVANLREIALQARALAGLAAAQLLQVAALLLQRVLLAAQLHFRSEEHTYELQ